jgi:hypothetical protein
MDLYNILGGISGITILYVLLMVLLSWSIIGIKGRWITKGLFMAVAIWFSVTLYYSFHNFMGWPTEETISTQYSQLIWFQIKEPSKVTNHPGAIYLWVRELSSKEEPEGLTLNQLSNPMTWFTYPDESVPRAYKIPYSKKKHRELRKAAEGRKTGVRTYVEVKKKKKRSGRPGQQEVDDEIRFKLINPKDILPKE